MGYRNWQNMNIFERDLCWIFCFERKSELREQTEVASAGIENRSREGILCISGYCGYLCIIVLCIVYYCVWGLSLWWIASTPHRGPVSDDQIWGNGAVGGVLNPHDYHALTIYYNTTLILNTLDYHALTIYNNTTLTCLNLGDNDDDLSYHYLPISGSRWARG